MPFQSEKQRRYLWATHPEIAKRWAHKYPKSNKGLPMYASDKDDKTEKSSATPATPIFQALSAPIPADRTKSVFSILDENPGENSKNADSKQERVTIPRSEDPVYAGEEREEGKIDHEIPETPNVNNCQPENAINSLLQKISVVLAPALAQEQERRKALLEGRSPQPTPKNVNLKNYPSQTAVTPPPMGLTAPTPPQPPQPQQPQPAQPANTGMNSPSANPIQSFGPLSMTGNINGNAAFGAKNSPDSMKISAAIEKWAAGNPTLAWLNSMEFPIHPEPEDFAVLDDESDGLRSKAAAKHTPCSCGCGDTVQTCKCGPDCSCRKPGGSCYKAEEKAAKQLGLWDRIRAKKQRGEKPAKPGDKDYPDAKSWEKVTKASAEKAADKQAGLFLRNLDKNPENAVLLPVGKTNRAFQVAEKYREPRLLARPFYHSDNTALENAMMYAAMLDPTMLERVDLEKNKPMTPHDAVNVGLNLKVLYPDRFRLPPDGEAALAGNPEAATERKSTLDLMQKLSGTPAWQRSEGKNDEGGLNAKGRASYNRATGGNLKAPVTEKNPKGKRAKRQNSFCSRMCGMKKHETGSKTKKDPDSRINKALRKWNCKCSAYAFGQKMAAAPALIADLQRQNQMHQTVNRAASLISPALLNAIGKRLGTGVGPALSLGASLGHAGVGHGLNTQRQMLNMFQPAKGQPSQIRR